MSPILIVGAGPVGLTMAVELARFGMSVRIIERNQHPTDTSRALVIWSRTLELLDRSGSIQLFLDAGLKAHGASLRAGQTVLGRPRFDDIASAYNFALMIPQRDTERLMIERLRSLAVEVERQVAEGYGPQPSIGEHAIGVRPGVGGRGLGEPEALIELDCGAYVRRRCPGLGELCRRILQVLRVHIAEGHHVHQFWHLLGL